MKAKEITNEAVGKYDESVNCRDIYKIYDKDTLSTLAANEWISYYMSGGDDTEDRQIAPTLSCFCSEEYKELGSDVQEERYKTSDG